MYKILIIPDNKLWVLGTISYKIKQYNKSLSITVLDFEQVRFFIKNGYSFDHFDIIHMSTNHVFLELLQYFNGKPIVTSIFHLENDIDEVKYIIANSNAIMTGAISYHKILEQLSVINSHIFLYNLGVDCNIFKTTSINGKFSIRQNLKIPVNAIVIGFSAKKSSNTSQRKGVDTLQQALIKLKNLYPDFYVIITGSGWEVYANALENIGINVVYTGFLLTAKEVATIYQCLDFYWITSRIEGGPMTLLEAMSCGVCCITTPVGIVPEVIQEGENGYVVDFDDSDTFADTTYNLIPEIEKRNSIALNARNFVYTHRQWKDTYSNMTSMYEAAINDYNQKNTENVNGNNTNPVKFLKFSSFCTKAFGASNYGVFCNSTNKPFTAWCHVILGLFLAPHHKSMWKNLYLILPKSVKHLIRE